MQAVARRIVARVDELLGQTAVLAQQLATVNEQRRGVNTAVLHQLTQATTQASEVSALTHNFDRLYMDADTVAELKQAILQLAVQGRLVPQDEGDEDAAVLLARIQEEKKLLKEQKRLKPPRGLEPINFNSVPYKIVGKWKWAKIGDIAFVTKLAGFEYTKHINLTEVGEVPVIRAQNVRMNYLDEDNLLYIDSQTSKILERSALLKPCILMTFIGAGIGDVAIFKKRHRYHLAPNVAKLELYWRRP